MGLFQRVLVRQEDRHHLIAGGRVLMGAGCDKDRVGVFAVGDDRGVLLQPAAVTLDLDGAYRIAQVPTDAAFGRGRAKEQLVSADPAHEIPMPAGFGPVRDKARHLDLVHGEDHGACGAALGHDGAEFGDLGSRAPLTAAIDGDLNPEQSFRLYGIDRFFRETTGLVDIVGMHRGDCGDTGCACLQALVRRCGAEVHQATFLSPTMVATVVSMAAMLAKDLRFRR